MTAAPPNAFDDARRVEALSRRELLPFIQGRADDGRYIITDKGPLARLLQEQCGDVLYNVGGNGTVVAVELKAETRHTGNLFLETWSNRNLYDKTRHALRGSNPGWLVKSCADLLFYHFLDGGQLYIAPMFELQQWAFTGREFYGYPERCQAKRQQENDSWGRCVPWRVLARAIPGFHRCYPRQFELLPEETPL